MIIYQIVDVYADIRTIVGWDGARYVDIVVENIGPWTTWESWDEEDQYFAVTTCHSDSSVIT